MNDTEVISWMHHLAVSADSDVLADDLHSLANSFSEYAENGAIDDEIDELEQGIVMDKHDVYDWLVDELEQRGVNGAHGFISHVYFPLDYLDEKPPAIYVQESVVKDVDMPQSPAGWEWKRYTNTREPNYLVKKQ
jgi:hypothetical protein